MNWYFLTVGAQMYSAVNMEDLFILNGYMFLAGKFMDEKSI